MTNLVAWLYAFDLEHAQAPVDLPAVVQAGDRLLPRIAALRERDVRLVQPGLGGKDRAVELLAPGRGRGLDPDALDLVRGQGRRNVGVDELRAGLAQLLVLTVLLDWMNGWPELRKAAAFPPGSWVWIAFAVGVHQLFWLGGMVRRRARGTPLNAATEHLLPHSGAERLAFAAVALAAGISEEFLFRGYVTDQLLHWGLPVAAAVGLVNLSFGVYHGYKSLGGMIRTGMVGLALAVPVLATGALLPAMIAHTAMDVIAGWFTIPLARRWGFARQDAGAEVVQAAAESLGSLGTSRDA